MSRSEVAQIVGSLLAALAIAAVAVIVVTAHFGPTSTAELEAREERLELRLERREAELEAREEARREAAERREEARDGE